MSMGEVSCQASNAFHYRDFWLDFLIHACCPTELSKFFGF